MVVVRTRKMLLPIVRSAIFSWNCTCAVDHRFMFFFVATKRTPSAWWWRSVDIGLGL